MALTRLRAIARRLAGALRLIPGGDKEDPVLVEPSPEVSASLTVYAPVWLGPEDLVAVLQPIAPEVSTALEAVQPRGAVGLDAIDPEELESLVERIGPDVFKKAWRDSKKVHHLLSPLRLYGKHLVCGGGLFGLELRVRACYGHPSIRYEPALSYLAHPPRRS